MFATPAFAQGVGSAAAATDPGSPLGMGLMLVGFIAIMYFFMIRPQQQQAKRHKAMIGGIKRNDTVVMSSGLIGKVTRVEENEIMVEIATGVNVRVVKSMVTEVRAKGEPAPGNDNKAA